MLLLPKLSPMLSSPGYWAKCWARPTIFPVPTFAARLLFGEMAEETMLASTRVAPDKAEKAGYQFRYPGAESALRHLLGKK